MNHEELKMFIEQAWDDRNLIETDACRAAVLTTIDLLDRGELRAAEPVTLGGSYLATGTQSDNEEVKQSTDWQVNEWVKKAILLYFQINKMETNECGPFEYHDKIPLKHGFESIGVRVVPPAVARHGAYLAKGVVMMPSYVNIGAYVGSGTMVDTWATVGSCAQIGSGVHLSGGVGVGGVLEPLQAAPVVIEDDCFIGSRAIVVEGVHIGREAVLGANTVITASTHIIDVTGAEPVEYRGYVPASSVVIPGTYTKRFPAGDYQVSCALIIGHRTESTDKKTSLNAALRDYGVSI